MIKDIVIIGPAHPIRGGISDFNMRLAREFQNQGYNVSIETFKLQYPKILFPGKTQLVVGEAKSDIPINISINSINPYNWLKIGRKLKKQKPSLIIVGYWLPFMSPCFSTINFIAKRNKHTKIISVLHNIIPHEGMIGSSLLSRIFTKSVDAFVPLSKSVLNDLSIFTKDKPRAQSPHPLYDHFGAKIDKNEALKQLNYDPTYKYVLFFGLVRSYKGLDLLLHAFADERLKSQKIKLIVAGEFYSNEEQYQKLIDELNIRSQVIINNRFIPTSEVPLFFSACDLVAQPYKSATQSGVTQVGFHFEVPMLVTNVGGLAEIIPNNKAGYVVEPDPLEIAEKIDEFFSENKTALFTENVIKEKAKYSWRLMTDTILDLHSVLLNNK